MIRSPWSPNGQWTNKNMDVNGGNLVLMGSDHHFFERSMGKWLVWISKSGDLMGVNQQHGILWVCPIIMGTNPLVNQIFPYKENSEGIQNLYGNVTQPQMRTDQVIFFPSKDVDFVCKTADIPWHVVEFIFRASCVMTPLADVTMWWSGSGGIILPACFDVCFESLQRPHP